MTAPALSHAPENLQAMAQAFHAHDVNENPKQLPDNMRPWEKLPDTYKKADLEQARYAVEILRAAGFDVRRANGGPDAITSLVADRFTADVDRMA